MWRGNIAIGLAMTFGLMTLIIVSVNQLLAVTLNDAITREGEHKASQWVRFFNDHMPDLQVLVTSGQPTGEQIAPIESAVQFGEVFRFKLFDPNGRLVLVSNEARFRAEKTTEYDNGISKKARAVFDTGTSNISINDGTEKPNRPDVYIEAYVQALDANRSPFAVIEVYTDETPTSTLFHSVFDWLAIGLPAFCAFAYVFPAIGFLARSAQVRRRDEKVQRLSRFDALTGLLNRLTLTHEGELLFAADSRRRPKVGVFYIDVDNFKTINDDNGHEFGDSYLCHISAILSDNLRDTDLIGRMGGDEYVAILSNASVPELETIAGRILESASKPFTYKGRTITGSISIGTHLSVHGESMDDALQAADLALYQAKKTGRNKIIRYYAGLDTARQRRRNVEARMTEALETGEFELHYQPLLNCETDAPVGFEALLRLSFKDGEKIAPDEFIPVAEETGLINEIGEMVLRMAITEAKSWPSNLFVAVNLSPVQFEKNTLVGKVADLLKEFDFPAERLELEVTESLLLADEESVTGQLAGLKSIGVSLAMDDFGTGYSSLGYLWRFGFDKLKVDRAFLEGFEFDSDRYRRIIETIIVLGHQMDMKVAVEGVETERQHNLLKSLHCDENQGFLLGRPKPIGQFASLIDTQHPGDGAEAGSFSATG